MVSLSHQVYLFPIILSGRCYLTGRPSFSLAYDVTYIKNDKQLYSKDRQNYLDLRKSASYIVCPDLMFTLTIIISLISSYSDEKQTINVR